MCSVKMLKQIKFQKKGFSDNLLNVSFKRLNSWSRWTKDFRCRKAEFKFIFAHN